MHKCICLYSGGLDSRLVIALMARQPGLEVIAYHGLHCFEGKATFDETKEKVTRECLALGAKKAVFRDMTAQIAALLRGNRYGFGKNLNPCLDCRINTVRNGFEVMKEEGAEFVCSGEVIGQRPKSQQRDGMNAVQNSVDRLGCTGRLLRPLCAKLMEPTIAETEGIVNRENLYDFSGRGRQPQFALARELGVTDYPAPAGGCLLTDVGFCRRLEDLLESEKEKIFENNEFDLLKFGRHYRTGPRTKIVVARDGIEGDRIETLTRPGDRIFITEPLNGALVLLRGEGSAQAEELARGLAVWSSKYRDSGCSAVLREEFSPQGRTQARSENCPALNPEQLAAQGRLQML